MQSMLFRLAQTDGMRTTWFAWIFMMPEMHGKAAVREIRALEESERYAIAYVLKPVDTVAMVNQIESLALI